LGGEQDIIFLQQCMWQRLDNMMMMMMMMMMIYFLLYGIAV
jgi:hypothetical protein